MNTSSKYVGTRDAAAYCGLGKSTFDKLRLTGSGPTFCRPTPRRVVYDVADLDAWLTSRRRRSTSDVGSAITKELQTDRVA